MTTTPGGPDPQAYQPDRDSHAPDRIAEFTLEHRAALDLRRTDQDRTLVAVHSLEAALAAAAPGRETTWQDEVRAALDVLHDASAEEARNAAEPDSILSDIARTQPRLRHRVHGLRAQYRQVTDTINALQHELDEIDERPDVADLRQRIAWLISSLRHQRARESDLIYEAYYEAFQQDLEPGADGTS
jgi:ATP phosphoribosyltransferase regulatory subunit HisZ